MVMWESGVPVRWENEVACTQVTRICARQPSIWAAFSPGFRIGWVYKENGSNAGRNSGDFNSSTRPAGVKVKPHGHAHGGIYLHEQP